MEIKLRKRKRRIDGYTFIELILVVALLGVFSGILIPNFLDYKISAQDRVDEVNAKLLTNIAHRINAENGCFPSWPEAFTNLQANTFPYFEKDVTIQNSKNSFYYDSSKGTVTVKTSKGDITNPNIDKIVEKDSF